MVENIIGAVIGGLILAAILWVIVKGWAMAEGPIYLPEKMEKWTEKQKKMLTDAGYDLETLVRIPDDQIGQSVYRDYKRVRVGWWLFKRPVHTGGKNGGRSEPLFEKP